MRIAISGAQNTGKSTLVRSFLHTWTNYSKPKSTYREKLKADNIQHSSKTTPSTQKMILDSMVDQMLQTKVDDNIIYDRCPLDVLAYTIWSSEKGKDGFDDGFITDQINIVRESMRFIDIVFLCKYNRKLDPVEDGQRDTNKTHIVEIDNIFESIFQQYTQNLDADIFFPKDDSPCVIKLPHTQQERIDIIQEYVTPEGTMYGDEDSILNPDNIADLEKLVMQQKAAQEGEEAQQELLKKFHLPVSSPNT